MALRTVAGYQVDTVEYVTVHLEDIARIHRTLSGPQGSTVTIEVDGVETDEPDDLPKIGKRRVDSLKLKREEPRVSINLDRSSAMVIYHSGDLAGVGLAKQVGEVLNRFRHPTRSRLNLVVAAGIFFFAMGILTLVFSTQTTGTGASIFLFEAFAGLFSGTTIFLGGLRYAERTKIYLVPHGQRTFLTRNRDILITLIGVGLAAVIPFAISAVAKHK